MLSGAIQYFGTIKNGDLVAKCHAAVTYPLLLLAGYGELSIPIAQFQGDIVKVLRTFVELTVRRNPVKNYQPFTPSLSPGHSFCTWLEEIQGLW